MMQDTEYIVAEVSKNWPELAGEDDYPRFISQRFEHVIEVNRQKGYRLDSWHLNRIPHLDGGANETIVAVFRREEADE